MRSGKLVMVVVLVAAVLGITGGVWWYVVTPHTPEAQFAHAEKLEGQLRGDAATKAGPELQPQIVETVEDYRKVGTRFGPNPKAAEGLKRIAKIEEEVEKDPAKALATLEELGKGYGEEENAGYALREEERMIRAQADGMKLDGKANYGEKYKEALGKLDAFRKQFAASKDAPEALLETGRIWQDGLEDPLIRSIETFEQVLKEFPHSDQEPEALFRLAKAYEKAKEFERAVQLYTQMLELYPKCKWAPEALFAKGKILADKMDKQEEAAKAFEKVTQDFPDDPHAQSAAAEGKSAQQKAAGEKGEEYGKQRYGGSVPLDTSADKAVPPAAMMKEFAAQKLDAEAYDLNVTFAPSEQRITVDGTLKLTNRGEEKSELLFMLGNGLKISKMTVDGAAAVTNQAGDTLKVVLPAKMKKEGTATLAFGYTGQFAAPNELIHAKPPMGAKNPTTAPATGPASAPATTTAPASKYAMSPQMGLGEYGFALSGAAWYPVTIIGDVFDAHLTIKTPANMEAVANGALVKREKSTKEGTPGVFEFETKSPVFGLYFAYGPYVEQETTVGGIAYYTYFKPENAKKHAGYVEVANKILSFYGSKYVKFPYEKLAVVEVPLPPFLGGVGPASLMFLQDSMVAHPEVPETLLAHELAHQWFGNLIPINIADPSYNQWLSEGFATYSDALYTEFKDGPAAFRQHIERYDQLFFQFAMAAGKKGASIRDTFSPMTAGYRPVVYEKGALVLHMLRKVMGDEKFFGLMRTYLETYKNKQTTVDDFRRLASSVYGEDLSWFFAEWYDGSVFAHWVVTADVKAMGGAEAGYETTVLITQPDELVRMPADVTLYGEKGEKEVKANVLLDKKENTVVAKTGFKVVKVVVDEENWVLKRPGKGTIWEEEKKTVSK